MAEIISEKTVGNILILQVDGVPSLTPGVEAPMGSLATILGVGDLWQKTGGNPVDWSIILAGTGTPVAIGSSNQEGSSDLAARSDHVHSHGDQGGGSLHAVATEAVAGFMSASDKTKLDGLGESASLKMRIGVVSAVTFSGSPQRATVTFDTAMPSSSYAVTLTGADARAWTFESKTINGFVINSNAALSLTGEVQYHVIENFT